MTTRTRSRCIPGVFAVGILAVALSGCASEASQPSESGAVETSAGPVTSTDGPTTDVPDTRAPDPSGPDTSASETSGPGGPVEVSVAVGVDSDPERVERVAFGTEVRLTITNGPDPAEYHVHGIDLEVAAEADQTVTLTFVANVDGPYEVEDHETGAVILVIEVDQ